MIHTGTDVLIAVAFQLLAVASTPLNRTVLAPWVAPKLAPAIDAASPHAPGRRCEGRDARRRDHCEGTPCELWPVTVTTTGPVAAQAGTLATIDVVLQLVAVAPPLTLTTTGPLVAPDGTLLMLSTRACG